MTGEPTPFSIIAILVSFFVTFFIVVLTRW
jgi:hypothetical protein